MHRQRQGVAEAVMEATEYWKLGEEEKLDLFLNDGEELIFYDSFPELWDSHGLIESRSLTAKEFIENFDYVSMEKFGVLV